MTSSAALDLQITAEELDQWLHDPNEHFTTP